MEGWQIFITIAGSLVALGGFIFTVYSFSVSRKDKRHAAHDERFKEHSARFEQHENRIEGNEKEIRETRDVLHRDYARVDQVENMEKKILHSMSELHHRMGGISKDLNQTIGEMNANRTAEMQQVVSQITHAIKDGG